MTSAPNTDGSALSLAILVARFNEHVTSRLLDGAIEAVERCGVRKHAVYHVPGSFELPVTALALADTGEYDAIVCLGAVIRHETDHYRYVAGEAAAGLRQVAIETGVPCLFAVLTCDTDEQALARAGGDQGNKGSDAVEAAIETANLMRSLGAGRQEKLDD